MHQIAASTNTKGKFILQNNVFVATFRWPSCVGTQPRLQIRPSILSVINYNMTIIPIGALLISPSCICGGRPVPAALPDVIPFAVSLSIPDEACAGLVQVLAALGTFQTCSVPLQVRGDPQDVLVVYLVPAAHAERHQPLLWKRKSTKMFGERWTHLNVQQITTIRLIK